MSATELQRDHDFEYRMVAADGRVVWLRDLVSVVAENGQASKLRGVMLDVTARRHAENAQREQASLLDLTHDTIFVRDKNDVIPTGIAAPRSLTGGRGREALGQVTHNAAACRRIFPCRWQPSGRSCSGRQPLGRRAHSYEAGRSAGGGREPLVGAA